MKIIHIAAECAPVAKEGGLADVIQGLSRELLLQGHQVKIFLPFYDSLHKEYFDSLEPQKKSFEIIEDGISYEAYSCFAKVAGCELILLDADHPEEYFHRKSIYGFKDDVARFLFFSKLVLEYLTVQKQNIDILHLHDWHTAICPLLYEHIYKDRGLDIGKTVLTIHNLEHQGKGVPDDLTKIGLDGQQLSHEDYLRDPDPAHPHRINLLKAGIMTADSITTVSPSYAQEILTPEYGFYLDPTLRSYRGKITGIINGIDNQIWNPRADKMIPFFYSSHDSAEVITEQKRANKHFLQKKLDMAKSDLPLFVCITRLVPQKGPELIEAALLHVINEGGQFVLLGSSPIHQIQHRFELIEKKFRSNSSLKMIFDYNEKISHLIFAAADFLVMPSIFEPCGLSQLIALSYGTIPIVRKTGGLKDTVFDISTSDPLKNGFVFADPTAEDTTEAIDRAFGLYSLPEEIQGYRKKAMKTDYSWKTSARDYLQIYSD